MLARRINGIVRLSINTSGVFGNLGCFFAKLLNRFPVTSPESGFFCLLRYVSRFTTQDGANC